MDTGPHSGIHPPVTRQQLHDLWRKHFSLDESGLEALDIILAAALDRSLGGDPIWLYVVGPPSSLKTEILRSLSDWEVMTLSNLTSKTLLSGFKGDVDLLPQLDGKVLVIKDFTTIIQKQRDERREICAQLRDAYDGYYEKGFGTARKKSARARFGLIAAVTGVIDRTWSIDQIMGERFLKVRLRTDPESAAEQAWKNVGYEKEIRKEMRTAIAGFLHNLEVAPEEEVKFADSQVGEVMDLSSTLALCRTPIMRDHMKGELTDVPEPEIPARLVKQLKKLTAGLAVVRGRRQVEDSDLAATARVVADTIPPKRRLALDALADGKAHGLKEVSERTRLPDTTTRYLLDDLWFLGIVTKSGESCYSLNGRCREAGILHSRLLKKSGGNTG